MCPKNDRTGATVPDEAELSPTLNRQARNPARMMPLQDPVMHGLARQLLGCTTDRDRCSFTLIAQRHGLSLPFMNVAQERTTEYSPPTIMKRTARGPAGKHFDRNDSTAQCAS